MAVEPHHFTKKDFGKAMLGSFIIGFNFLFNNFMFQKAVNMKTFNVVLVILITFLIVTVEIYALSYRFVKDRKQRPFYEFWAKRFFAITIASFLVIYLLIYVYGLNSFLTHTEMIKLSSAIFMPASIVGAAVEILKKQ